jgi:hypothetical protein
MLQIINEEGDVDSTQESPPQKVKSSQVQEFKILGSECQSTGTYAKRAKQATKKTIACVF